MTFDHRQNDYDLIETGFLLGGQGAPPKRLLPPKIFEKQYKEQ